MTHHIEHTHDRQQDERAMLGFWVYLMSDCLLFASLFATYAVLRNNTFGGASGAELFDLSFVLVETLVLLTSSFTSGLGLRAAHRGNVSHALVWFAITFVLGVAFLVLEISEFSTLIGEGNGWQSSAFLSAFFTLLGTHGAHVAAGLLWLGVLFVQVFRRGMTSMNLRRLTCFSMFWHFLDIVWIFIFSFVYLLSFV
jgi:cytochrome o ubiquinol oxidase subunit 3